jgi:hypothetical protein
MASSGYLLERKYTICVSEQAKAHGFLYSHTITANIEDFCDLKAVGDFSSLASKDAVLQQMPTGCPHLDSLLMLYLELPPPDRPGGGFSPQQFPSHV